MTDQEARDELGAHLFELETGRTDWTRLAGESGEYLRELRRRQADPILAWMAENGYRKHPEPERVRTALETAWDQGNATGLDGWVGPGRGTLPIDDEAVRSRRRDVDRIMEGLT
ncbi:hypothetical protein ACFVR6_03760 [Microbacterium sp. NPDC058021]|uniref:hypothetical protein n=1 Tax=Microbacterium sp. NPDC058021 TaxID=3346306 RepID=UPI0036DA0EC3